MATHKIHALYPSFTWEEVTCRHCGEVIVDGRFWDHMQRLQDLRDWWGAPLSVSSGHRCLTHNQAVGGVPDSQHLRFATDVHPSLTSPHVNLVSGVDGRRLQIALSILHTKAEELFDGIGTYATFLHLDLRGELARWDERTGG